MKKLQTLLNNMNIELRDEKQQMEEDKNNVCFICGLSRDEVYLMIQLKH